MPKLAHQTQFNRNGLVLTLAVTVVVGAAIVYAEAAKPTTSGGGTKVSSASLSLTPSKSTVTAGQTFTVQVRENSGTTTVNAVQADLVYPADKLTLVSIDDTGSAFGVKATEAEGVGTAEITRGNTTPLTGNQLVATLNFQAEPGKGSSNVTFAGTSALLASQTNTNVISTTSGATFQLAK